LFWGYFQVILAYSLSISNLGAAALLGGLALGGRWEVVDEFSWTFVAAACRTSAFRLKYF